MTFYWLRFVYFFYIYEAAEGEAAADQATGEALVTSESSGDGEEVKEPAQEGGEGEAEGEGEGPAVDPLAAEMSEEVEEKNEDITDSSPSTSEEADSQVVIA